MKNGRLSLIALISVFIFSVWTPAPALARAESGQDGAAKAEFVSLTIINRTYGPLRVTLQGAGGSYSFLVVQGKSTYQIVPGKYTYSVRYAPNNICKYWITAKYPNTRVNKQNFVNMKNVLGPYHLCTLK